MHNSFSCSILFSFSGVNDFAAKAPVRSFTSIITCQSPFEFFFSRLKYRFSVDTNVVSDLLFLAPIIFLLSNNQIYLVTDRRTFKDRRDVWAIEKKNDQFVAERPKAKIKKITEDQDETVPRKSKAAATPKEDLVN